MFAGSRLKDGIPQPRQGSKGMPVNSRPLSWRGPRQQQSRSSSKRILLQRYKLLQLMRTGGVVDLMAPAHLGKRRARLADRLAEHVVIQLRTIQLQTIAVQRNIDHHFKWIRAEMTTLPGIVVNLVEDSVNKMNNLIRFLITAMVMFVLLRW